MKLKIVVIDNHIALVDESAEIKEDDLCEYKNKVFVIKKGDNELFQLANRVLFAEPELNLDVPQLNWREWEVEQYVNKEYPQYGFKDLLIKAIVGYNHNKAEYAKDDLIKAFRKGAYIGSYTGNNSGKHIEEEEALFIQSLQKYPKWIVMESELIYYPANMPKDGEHRPAFRPKLITNSDGKQEGIIKEIIW